MVALMATVMANRVIADDVTEAPPRSAVPPFTRPVDTLCPGEPAGVAYTFQRPDGNRLAAGTGSLPETAVSVVDLSGVPVWLLALATDDNAVLWVAVLESGRVEGFRLGAGVLRRIFVGYRGSGRRGPQLIVDSGGRAHLVDGLVVNERPFVLNRQTLHACDTGSSLSLPLRPLPDGYLLAAGGNRLLFLTGPTDRYRHAIMGDSMEASGVALIDTAATLRVQRLLEIPAPGVVEGRLPIWADMDGDGEGEIILTVSDPESGARIVAYTSAGRQLAVSPAVGRGFRWRHQIAVAPFGVNDELELAEVLTPHLGGVVQFYRLRGDRLEIVARLPGYSSHQIGSPNLDMAVAGDFDADGRVELLVPEQSYRRLAAIRRTPEGADAVWALELGARLSSNIATVADADGRMAVGVGTENGKLRIWQRP